MTILWPPYTTDLTRSTTSTGDSTATFISSRTVFLLPRLSLSRVLLLDVLFRSKYHFKDFSFANFFSSVLVVANIPYYDPSIMTQLKKCQFRGYVGDKKLWYITTCAKKVSSLTWTLSAEIYRLCRFFFHNNWIKNNVILTFLQIGLLIKAIKRLKIMGTLCVLSQRNRLNELLNRAPSVFLTITSD